MTGFQIISQNIQKQLKSNGTMTTKQLADALGVQPDVIKGAVKNCGSQFGINVTRTVEELDNVGTTRVTVTYSL